MTDPQPETTDRMENKGIPQPRAVTDVRVLGCGRAAEAILVDATFECGKTVRCVEKRFSPGWLTRLIYRIGFQSPFAYKSNQNAILTCYYRRLVVSQILKGLDSTTKVAKPLYVRFDSSTRSWVLAAEWIRGRGIRPATANPDRPLQWIRKKLRLQQHQDTQTTSEVDELVEVMKQLESKLHQCGLGGTGWQVSPQAIVSTANLLRVDNHYVAIDLESGIPAVLVLRYLVDGIRRFQLPPFDDLDETVLARWYQLEREQLAERIGRQESSALDRNIEQLITHHQAWKQSELALFRSPLRWLKRSNRQSYRTECVRRWQQDKIIDQRVHNLVKARATAFALIWVAGLLPGRLGRLFSRLLGHQKYRQQLQTLLFNRQMRKRFIGVRLWRGWRELKKQGRVRLDSTPRWLSYQVNFLFSRTLSVKAHQVLTDPRHRKQELWRGWLLLSSPHYQTRHANRMIHGMIRQWETSKRLLPTDAQRIRQAVSAREMRHYMRGFSSHLSLKVLSPLLAPLKIAGLVSFYETTNPIYLAPLFATSALRFSATLVNRWASRKDTTSHHVALSLSWLPFVGILSFPVQMYASNKETSQFLIRDFASRLGKKLPIYGGEDSRLEIGVIRATDWIFGLMKLMATPSSKIARYEAGSSALVKLGKTVRQQRVENVLIEKEQPPPASNQDHESSSNEKPNQERLAA